MPTQKTFKRRVRARMTKTGESYTAARHQLLGKADGLPQSTAPGSGTPNGAPGPAASEAAAGHTTTAEAAVRATGKTYPEWFALLDAWGATERRHGEITSWLSTEHGVPPWWTQAVTVSYERARGLRAVHEMKDGYTVGVTRTIAASPGEALAAFTDPEVRRRWLGDVDLVQRRTTATGNVRFDWPDPPSRLAVYAGPKGTDRAVVSIAHERLPDADTADRIKAEWRERMGALKAYLEGG